MEETGQTESKKQELSPMLRYYCELKEKYADCLLLFQVGDFYELFFEDAVTVSKTLNLTLTSRDKKNPEPIPMCGVPVAVVDSYAGRLVDAGYSVAIVSQVDTPVKNGVTVGRYLERIITPGIRLLASAKDEAGDAVVAAVHALSTDSFSIAASSVQSGVIEVLEEVASADLTAEIQRLSALEVILPLNIGAKKIDKRVQWVKELTEQFGAGRIKFRGETQPGAAFDGQLAAIVNYASLSPSSRRAVRLLVQYVDETTVGLGVQFQDVLRKSYEEVLNIDAATRNSLELLRNGRDLSKDYSLYGILDCTVSAEGSRLLRRWITAPLKSVPAIEARLASVRLLKKMERVRSSLREILKFFPDCERIAARMTLGVVAPGELANLRDAYLRIPEIKELLNQCEKAVNDQSAAQIAGINAKLQMPTGLVERLQSAIVEHPAPSFNEGEIIRHGYNSELDRLRDLRRHGRQWVADLEQEEREKTGIQSLKLRFNQAFGFFIEVTKANLHKVPSHYIRKQTTVNGERFTTEELRAREQDILNAESRESRLQKDLFNELRQELQCYAAAVREIGDLLSVLDVLSAFADLAEREAYVEPEMSEEVELSIQEGRHPVLGKVLGPDFVVNSLYFSENASRCVVLTGPNMGGKSTFLRQNALIVIMAHIGSFVPARRARIGLVDRVFSRIGTADNMVEGDSTFMVEMREASAIVKNASERSLVVIDEIGRGTATADGLALAQAILEWLVVRVKCRTLFATHFHELTVLEERYPAVKNLSVGSVEKDSHLIFTYHIRDGAASKSYGIEVAKLAGLPPSLIKRAKEALQARQKEKMGIQGPVQQGLFDAPLLLNDEDSSTEDDNMGSAEKKEQIPVKFSAVLERISALDVSRLTPLEALNFLDALRSELLADEGDDEFEQ